MNKRLNITGVLSTRNALGGILLFLCCAGSGLNAGTVTGRVFDSESQTYLNGAVVSAKMTDAKAVTDKGGFYKLELPEGAYTIQARYFGYPLAEETLQVTGIHEVDFDMIREVKELEAFVVEGRAVGQARALNLQKSSEVTANVVSADAIGQFPDQNAAEALGRLPGVSIERDQGEGRFVVIRGINPDLNSVAIDGVKLAAPGADERATLLDTVPSDTIQQLEVYKTVLPSMPGDSVGGYVNIKTPSAFDFDDTVGRITVQGNFSDLVDEWEGKINGSYGNVFNDGKTGFMINASWEERTFGSDNNEAAEWGLESGSYVTDEIEYREYDLTRTRTGISGNLEFKPDNDSFYFARLSYNEYEDSEIRHVGLFEIDGFDSVSSSSFVGTDTTHIREFKDRTENMGVRAASVGGENYVGLWKIDYKLSYSYAEEDTPFDTEAIYELNDVVDVRLDNTDTYQLGLSQVAGPDFLDPSNYEFDEVADAFQLVEEEDLSGEINFLYEFVEGAFKDVQFGMLYRDKSKVSDAEEFASDDNPAAIEDYTNFSTFDNRDPLNTMLPYTVDTIRSFYLDNEAAFMMERDLADSSIEDFDASEEVFAAYAMGRFTFSNWDYIVGFRFEGTNFETEGFEYNDDTETIDPARYQKDYTEFLPHLHIRRQFGDNMLLRFSANKTLSRPNFEQTLPGAEIEGDEVTVGNPQLDPLESVNVDASFEYYFPPLGVFSAAVFYKDIDNFIYEQTLTADFAGIVDAELTTFRNGPSGDIKGLELGYQQQFSGNFDGFGILANLTLTDGSAEVLGPEEGDPTRSLPFIKQSDTIANLALTYEKYGFFFRIAATYRDDYLDEVGGEPLEDRYVAEFLQWDLSSSYDINDNLTVFANLVNIDDEPFRAYWGQSGRLSQWESYSWSANLGLRWAY